MEIRALCAAGLVSLAALSCGLLGAEPGAIPERRDPYVGFVDGPGIEVCNAGSRLVSPSKSKGGDPLAICVAKGAEARSCVDSSDCGETESCVCGRCMTRPCSSSTDCGLQEVCQGARCTKACSLPADCRAGETCTGGGCSRRCSVPEDCAFGEKCSALDGTCIVKTCSPSVSCSLNDDCVAQQDLGDLREPHLIALGGERMAYVEVRRPAGKNKVSCAIYRARILQSRRWEIDPIEPVLSPDPLDADCLGAPSVLWEAGKFVLYASRGDGTAIVRASSTDGIHFEREPGEVVVPRFEWENGWVSSPGVARFGASLVLAYEAAQGKALGFATIGADGVANVVSWLTPAGFEDPVLWRNVDRLGAPNLLVREDTLLVYLSVHGVEGYDAVSESAGIYPADPNDSIGLIESRDLTNWVRFLTGPVFSRRTNLRAYLGEKDPSVLVTDSGSWLVYVGSDASGESLAGLSLASTGN